jgi:hypothetical protein
MATKFRKIKNGFVFKVNIASPTNPSGEIGSGYPTYVYDGNRLSLPILRQKMALSCGMMFLTCRIVVNM